MEGSGKRCFEALSAADEAAMPPEGGGRAGDFVASSEDTDEGGGLVGGWAGTVGEAD